MQPISWKVDTTRAWKCWNHFFSTTPLYLQRWVKWCVCVCVCVCCVNSPEEAEGNVDEELQVGYPGDRGVVQRPVASVHHRILINQVLWTHPQGTYETAVCVCVCI